jgi:pimeloyl-ACP methyl ester carboxylesterase
MSDRFEALAWDFPCHGSAPKLARPIDWWSFGRYALEQVRGIPGPLGVGHSMGGAALVMAELLAPGTFAALLLIEPILLPPPYVRTEAALALAVEKRRRDFESRQAAWENYATKPPFSTWDPDALSGYVDCGFIDTADGVTLACPPEDEAEIYRSATLHGAWDRLGEVNAPVLVIAGTASETHTTERVRALCDRFPSAGMEIVEGAGHFLPMEMPDLVVRRAERMAAVA